MSRGASWRRDFSLIANIDTFSKDAANNCWFVAGCERCADFVVIFVF